MGRAAQYQGRLAADVSGASAVEFAILTPVFLLLLIGMMAYAIYFGAAHSVQQIAADAARTSIPGLNQSERNQLVAAFLDKNAGDYVFIDPSRLTYEVGDKADSPGQYVVTLRYDATELPIWNLYLPLPLPSRVIAYRSVIRHGGL